jgi:tungstate transport system ATP-binding protein
MSAGASILPLTVARLGYAAGGTQLLHGLDFALPAGGMTIVLGANGAGKSLLLRLCHGLIAPNAGNVAYAMPGGRRDGVKRHAMVFQHPVMLRRSALANIVFALSAQGLDAATARRQAAAVLERFGLAALAGRPARRLSGGEQQRLAIGRAAALQPDLMFLDEPTAHLDPAATRQIESMLATLRAEGVTLMMTTHDLGQARRLADRILFLHRGRLLEDGPAGPFFAQPATAEARAFLAGDLIW